MHRATATQLPLLISIQTSLDLNLNNKPRASMILAQVNGVF